MPRSSGNLTQAVPFLAVSDRARALAFYVDGLGFAMTNRWIHEGADAAITGAIGLAAAAEGAPSDDGRWDGVALALHVPT